MHQIAPTTYHKKNESNDCLIISEHRKKNKYNAQSIVWKGGDHSLYFYRNQQQNWFSEKQRKKGNRPDDHIQLTTAGIEIVIPTKKNRSNLP
jgi:hypothetical protein